MNDASINVIRRLGLTLARAGGKDPGEVTNNYLGEWVFSSNVLTAHSFSLALQPTLKIDLYNNWPAILDSSIYELDGKLYNIQARTCPKFDVKRKDSTGQFII